MNPVLPSAHNPPHPPVSDDTSPVAKTSTFSGMDITALPNEVIEKILSHLSQSDISVCSLVNKQWKQIIDDSLLNSRSFYRSCHPMGCSPDSKDAVRCYYSTIRNWLSSFSNDTEQLTKLIAHLDERTGHTYFPELLFSSIAKVLMTAKTLDCKSLCVLQHSGIVKNASFSPDGNHVVTVSDDGTARIWGLVDGQWQEQATIRHDATVNNASFSPDGNHVVTASDDKTAKI